MGILPSTPLFRRKSALFGPVPAVSRSELSIPRHSPPSCRRQQGGKSPHTGGTGAKTLRFRPHSGEKNLPDGRFDRKTRPGRCRGRCISCGGTGLFFSGEHKPLCIYADDFDPGGPQGGRVSESLFAHHLARDQERDPRRIRDDRHRGDPARRLGPVDLLPALRDRSDVPVLVEERTHV